MIFWGTGRRTALLSVNYWLSKSLINGYLKPHKQDEIAVDGPPFLGNPSYLQYS